MKTKNNCKTVIYQYFGAGAPSSWPKLKQSIEFWAHGDGVARKETAGSAKLDYSQLFFVCGSNRTVTTTDMYLYTLDTDRMMKIFLHFAFFGIFSVL